MTEPNDLSTHPKCTRGEKCIGAHLVLTVGGIIVLLTIYLVHVLVVTHSESFSYFETRRVFSPTVTDNGIQKVPIGFLYLNQTPIASICNTLLLTPEWSISTGHCVAMQSGPELSYLLYNWRIKYSNNIEDIKIKRNLVHPHFNRDTFADNVGLMQHKPIPGFQKFKIPKISSDNAYYSDLERKNVVIISWGQSLKGLQNKYVLNVQFIKTENCSPYVAQIIELRKYEFCTLLKKKSNTILGYGALVVDVKDFTLLGSFSWGESQQKFLPSVVLNLSHFKEWIDSVTSCRYK